jgi:hypothetical protein
MNADLNPGYPPEVSQFAGRINDVDGHEWLPAELWVEEYGEITRVFAESEKVSFESMKDPNHGYLRTALIEAPEQMNPTTVWKTKGPYALGAYDMRERLAVLDYTGVYRQLVFPGTFAISACHLQGAADTPTIYPMIPGSGPERRRYALQLLDAYNEWVMRNVSISDRLRIVATLVAETPDALYDKAKSMINRGVRAFWLPSGILPGGKSPAHDDLDRFWSLLEDTNTTMALHLGNEANFFKTLDWRKAKAYEGWKTGAEISADPHSLATKSFATQNYLITMIGGAVFHRHPNLRVAAIELGAYWIGNLGFYMDLMSVHTLGKRWNKEFPLKPSEYLRKHVRVSGLPYEPIDLYIRRFGMGEVYAYASDYPHVEGGTNPMGGWAGGLLDLGQDVAEKFYVTNGAFVMPD